MLVRGDDVNILQCNYGTYFAIIGDIIDSKKIQDRLLVQQNMNAILDKISKKYEQNISSKFMITLGDEFQGLLNNGKYIIEIINTIEDEMHPIELRFGIGVGSITTPINHDLPIGADGPAYYNARKMIETQKKNKKKRMEVRTNISLAIEDNLQLSDLLNAIFSLTTLIKTSWTSRQREIINAYIGCDGNQNNTASMLDVNQSTIRKVLKASGFYEYRQANQMITNTLIGLTEGCDD